MKDTSSYPLYHKCGIHWSFYGAYFALDSILSYIEIEKGIDMAEMHIEGINFSDIPKYTDYDVGDALNLFFRIPYQPMAYPYGFSVDTLGRTKPNLMVVSDSYYWTIYNMDKNKDLWGELDFRYYNQASYSPGQPKEDPAVLTIEELSKFDVVMILYTEATMTKFANNFFEDAYITLSYVKGLEEIRQRILNTPEWLEDVKEKAIKNGVSLEDMIDMDAKWLLEKRLMKLLMNRLIY